jgi:hypothetical protein
MATRQPPRPEQEGFGEASLGEAQSENPPSDPEMLRNGDGDEEEPEEAAGDQDAGPTAAPEQVSEDPERDQAEG